MQIHELNNFTGTLGSGAYLAVDDGTDTGKLSTQGLLASTEARIDNLVSSVTVDSEVIDARYGADGVTYPSLGAAIRTQVSDLKSALSALDEVAFNYFDTSDMEFVIGGLTNQGEFTTNDKRVRSKSFYAKKGSSISIANGFQFNLARYSAYNDTTSFITGSYRTFSADPYIFKNDSYFIVSIKANDDRSFDADTMSDAVDALNAQIITNESTKVASKDETIRDEKNIWVEGAYIALKNYSIDDLVSLEKTASAGYKTMVIPCKKGERYLYHGYGGDNARAWGVLDNFRMLVSRCATTESVVSEIIAIEKDGYLVVNAHMSNATAYVYKLNILENTDEYARIKPPSMPDIFANVTSLPYSPNSLNWQEGDPVTPTFKGAYDRVIEGYDALVNAFKPVIPSENIGYYINASGVISSSGAGLGYSDAIPVERNTTYVLSGTYKASTTLTIRIHGYSSTTTSSWNEQIATASVSEDYAVSFNTGNNDYIRFNVYALDENLNVAIEESTHNVFKSSMGFDESNTIELWRYDFIPKAPYTNNNVNYVGKHTYTNASHPVVILDTGTHGDEKPCVYAMLNFMTLLAQAKGNDIFGWMKNNIHFVVVPFVNPYGFQHDTRWNYNHVDINRNYQQYWGYNADSGETDPTSSRYQGSSAMSERETRLMANVLYEFRKKALLYYSFHTHGVFDSYKKMTCYAVPQTKWYDQFQNIGYALIKGITNSGWTDHDLPTDSDYIGIIEMSKTRGSANYMGSYYGIPSVDPECMYRYYDGGSGAVLNNNNINCMNVEYILYAIGLACKEFLY